MPSSSSEIRVRREQRPIGVYSLDYLDWIAASATRLDVLIARGIKRQRRPDGEMQACETVMDW